MNANPSLTMVFQGDKQYSVWFNEPKFAWGSNVTFQHANGTSTVWIGGAHTLNTNVGSCTLPYLVRSYKSVTKTPGIQGYTYYSYDGQPMILLSNGYVQGAIRGVEIFISTANNEGYWRSLQSGDNLNNEVLLRFNGNYCLVCQVNYCYDVWWEHA